MSDEAIDPDPPQRRRRWPWVVAVVVVVGAVVAALLLTRDGETGSVPSGSSVPSASPTATDDAASDDAGPDDPAPGDGAPADATPAATRARGADAGCEPTGGGPPPGADVRDVVDVDADGRADRAWLTAGAGRELGITTASGATFSAPVTSASPVPAAAVVQVVQQDRVPIALVDVGREALLLAVVDCALVPVANAEGAPYVFDRGFAGLGTGVGCTQDGTTLRLVGLDAVVDDEGNVSVDRVPVDLVDGGRAAATGQRERIATGVPADAAVVEEAQTVTCGDLVAGRDGPVEPQP